MAKPGAKKQKSVSRVQQCLDVVAKALQQAPELPAEACAMLCGMLPNALGVEQDARHKYQDEMVEVVGQEMGNIESVLQKAIEEAVSVVQATTSEKASKEEAVDSAKSTLEAEQVGLEQRKVQLAEDALAFRAARAAHQQAESEQRTKCVEADAAVPKKAELEGLVEEMETVHERSGEVQQLMKRLKAHLSPDSSLETAMASALTKAPADRGPFDVMVFDQVRNEAAARLKQLGETIEAAVPMKAELAEATRKAAEALDASKDKQAASATAYTGQKAKTDEAAEALRAAQAACKEIATRLRKEERLRDSAEAELEVFQQGALASFRELQERTTPAPEPEQAADMAIEPVVEAAVAAVA